MASYKQVLTDRWAAKSGLLYLCALLEGALGQGRDRTSDCP